MWISLRPKFSCTAAAAMALAGIAAGGSARAATLTTIYSFCSQPKCADGEQPEAGLLNVGGTLYGTTVFGGKHHTGTIFSVTPGGAETVLHSFGGKGSGDGYQPEDGLLKVGRTLYGTTEEGGTQNGGTVFARKLGGKETVLYSFGSASGDGVAPIAGLTNLDGMLYGTTTQHGAANGGTVFSVTPQGAEGTLYSFGSHAGDGGFPEASLTTLNGTLYGTTANGGAHRNRGTVFSITPQGVETVLHSFGKAGDGAFPGAGLLNVRGIFYGTTEGGGANGFGTVFSIGRHGSEKVIYSFGNLASDGQYPSGDLVNVNGTLYRHHQRGRFAWWRHRVLDYTRRYRNCALFLWQCCLQWRWRLPQWGPDRSGWCAVWHDQCGRGQQWGHCLLDHAVVKAGLFARTTPSLSCRV